MRRDPRDEAPGAYYHVVTRGNDKQPIYFANWSGRLLVRSLGRYRQTARLDRVRVLPHDQPPPPPGASNLRGRLLERPLRTATASSRKCRTRPWNGRTTSSAGNSGARRSRRRPLQTAVRSALLNPERAGIIDGALRCRWSSLAATLGNAHASPPWSRRDAAVRDTAGAWHRS
jgi:hypothetical protein